MKTPIEWNDYYYNTDGIGMIELIIMIQKEAYNEGLDDAIACVSNSEDRLLIRELNIN